MSITTADLTRFRGVLDAYLPDSVQVLRYTQVQDDMGGLQETWTTHGSPVAALVVPWSLRHAGGEQVQQQHQDVTNLRSINLPANTDVVASDRIVVNSTDTYDVIEVFGPLSHEVLRECACVERLGE